MKVAEVRYGLVLVLLATLLSGCVVSSSVDLPDGAVLVDAPDQQQALLVTLRQKKSELTSFRALARARLEQDGKTNSFRELVAVNPPSDLRLEALPLNSAYTLQLLVCNKDRTLFLDVEKHNAFEDSSGDRLIHRVTKIPLDREAFLSLLLGRVPEQILDRDDLKIFKVGEDFLLSDAKGMNRLTINAKTLLVTNTEIRSVFDQSVLARISTHDQHKTSGILTPRNVVLELGDQKSKLNLNFAPPQINTKLKPELFTAEIPANFKAYKGEDFTEKGITHDL